ncbi:hypothetical protein [Tessaracoccus sp.]
MENRHRRSIAMLVGVAGIVAAAVAFILLTQQGKNVDMPAVETSTHEALPASVRETPSMEQ